MLRIESKQKEWVNQMLIPYSVFFAAACVASLAACIVKSRMLLRKWSSRVQPEAQSRRASLGGVPISEHLAKHPSVTALKERFGDRQLERRKYYCYVLSAVAQDIPVGISP